MDMRGFAASKEESLTLFAEAAERDLAGWKRKRSKQWRHCSTCRHRRRRHRRDHCMQCGERAGERRDIIIFQFVQAVSSVFSLNTDPIEAQGPPRYPSPSV